MDSEMVLVPMPNFCKCQHKYLSDWQILSTTVFHSKRAQKSREVATVWDEQENEITAQTTNAYWRHLQRNRVSTKAFSLKNEAEIVGMHR